MNISYLLSILDLYLMNELNKYLIVEVLKKENLIKIDFSYSNSLQNKTYVKLDKDSFLNNLEYFFEKLKSHLEIKEEKKENNSYNIIFSNNREIRFINFTDEELKIIRDKLNMKTDFSFNNILEDNKLENTYDSMYKENSKNKFIFSMGFSSFITIFLTAIWFLDIFLIALWIFKLLK